MIHLEAEVERLKARNPYTTDCLETIVACVLHMPLHEYRIYCNLGKERDMPTTKDEREAWSNTVPAETHCDELLVFRLIAQVDALESALAEARGILEKCKQSWVVEQESPTIHAEVKAWLEKHGEVK